MAPKLKISRPTPISNPFFQPLTPWEKFCLDPASFIAHWLYNQQPIISQFTACENTSESAITVVCISDTHCSEPDVPDGDILLHAGDLTNHGSFDELQKQLDYINGLPHQYKVVIGGNHDSLLDPAYVAQFPERIHEGEGTSRSDLNWGRITYLCNSTVKLSFNGRNINIYGSPWTPQYGSFAFQYPTIRQVWADTVPDDTDILLIHGPPKGHLDLQGKGCPQLLDEIKRVKPKLTVFGHIHAGRGRDVMLYDVFGNLYDRILKGALGVTVALVLPIFVATRWLFSFVSRPAQSKSTLLVNAAVVGGLKNDQTFPATVVHI